MLTLDRLKALLEWVDDNGDAPDPTHEEWAALLRWAISITEAASRAPETPEEVADQVCARWTSHLTGEPLSMEALIAAALQREREIAAVRLAEVEKSWRDEHPVGWNAALAKGQYARAKKAEAERDRLAAELAEVRKRMTGYIESQTANEAELKRADRRIGEARAELAEARRERDALRSAVKVFARECEEGVVEEVEKVRDARRRGNDGDVQFHVGVQDADQYAGRRLRELLATAQPSEAARDGLNAPPISDEAKVDTDTVRAFLAGWLDESLARLVALCARALAGDQDKRSLVRTLRAVLERAQSMRCGPTSDKPALRQSAPAPAKPESK